MLVSNILVQLFMKRNIVNATLAVCFMFTLSLCRHALQWSAGSCSVTLECCREEQALSWPCGPESGLKPSLR